MRYVGGLGCYVAGMMFHRLASEPGVKVPAGILIVGAVLSLLVTFVSVEKKR